MRSNLEIYILPVIHKFLYSDMYVFLNTDWQFEMFKRGIYSGHDTW